MQKFIPFLAAATLVASSAAMAQTTAPTTPPPAPSAVEITPPLSTKPGMSTTQDTSKKASAPMLTDEQAKAWINKVVYSSDDKNLGEVAAFQRDTAGNVTEMHADIGGFLGLGETRVRLMPSEFKLVTDRVVLNVTAEQAKNLPKIVM
ncbi:MAG: PRC-barrel domain-containing protein [Hyphomicrobium sp.]